MSKAILIFINIIGFLIFTILNVNDIEITHIAPSEIGINQETEVKIIIDKNDFSGPGRLRLDFAQALNIDVKEKINAGSSFTFKDNEVLFIWYDLPNEKNIEITYIITAEEGANGMKKIKGDFYTWHTDAGPVLYADGNTRKLSMTIQLSDQDEYEGGHFQWLEPNLQFDRMHGTNPQVNMQDAIRTLSFSSKTIGSVCVFPSFLYHQVTPVIWGQRKSLVCWFAGKPYV